MKYLTIVLSLVLIAEIALIVTREQNNHPTPVAPELIFDGYPAFTERTVRRRIESADFTQSAGWTDSADILFAAGFYAESEACYRQAVEMEPEHPQLRYNWAFCLASLGNIDSADQQFSNAIDRGHPHPEACRYLMGMNALRQGRRDKAIDLFTQSNDLAASRIELAQLALETSEYEQADELLGGLVEEQPNAWRVHHLKSVLARKTDDHESYVKHSALADVLSAPVSGPWHSRAAEMRKLSEELDIRTQVNDVSTALNSGIRPEFIYSQLVKDIEQEWDPALEDILSDLELNLGKPELQRERLQRIVDRDGMDSYRAARLGFVLLAQGDTSAGIEILKQGVDLRTGFKGTELTDMASAVASYHLSQNEDLEYARVEALGEFLSGIDLIDQLDVRGANSAFQRATMLDQSSPRYWFWLGRSQQLLGERAAAVDSYTECLKLNPYHERAAQYREALNSSLE